MIINTNRYILKEKDDIEGGIHRQMKGEKTMASIEYIAKRIEGKEKEISKLEKKLERILKAQATNWEVNPYWYNESDLKYTKRDIAVATETLNKYKEDLRVAQEKADSRNVKVIVDFLDDWKAKTKEFYIASVDGYTKALNLWYEQDHEYCKWWNWERRNATIEERKAKREEHDQHKESFTKRWNWMMPYMEGYTLNTEKLDRDLKSEADRKYDFIIERTNAIVGTITDASNLHIGMDAELNGYIIGENGKAKVQTIGAGGWNIQRYHFRTLIHEMR